MRPTRVQGGNQGQSIGNEPTQVALGREAADDLGERSTDKELQAKAATAAAESPIRTGASLGGRYQIVRLIARGSMSRIYQAEQSSIRRTVALKIIGHEFARDAQAVARFRQEAAVLANIQHPNIVTVHDIGSTAGGEPYIVMEYVDGPSLADVIRDKGRLAPARTAGLMLQISRALASVHGKGIVHRDMKPSNVLLASRARGLEIAKLVDFGLAKVIQDRSDGKFLTRTGTILGTPEYMSPEQIRGGNVDHRADIYSLGCMAYEMLTGVPPFVGEEMSTLYRHLHEKPRRMRDACPEGGIPDGFEPLIERAMAKEPEERFADCAELYRELLAVCDQAGIARSQLHLMETLFAEEVRLDLGAASAHDKLPGATAGMAAVAPGPPSRRRRIERWLLTGTAVVAALVAGVMIERRRAADPPAVRPVPEGAPASAAAAGPELLLVASTPPGATIELDGAPLRETTPTALRGVAPGTHSVILHLKGYGQVERQVEVAPGGRALIDVRLTAPTRTLVVRTVPSDALVFLDNRLVTGLTPATLALDAEEFHEIRVEKDGFEPLIKHLTPDDREPELSFTLDVEKRPIGAIWIESNDAAQVWIDGLDSGFVTPTFGIRLKTGRHTVELRDSAGNRSKPIKVLVTQGENEHLVLSVERKR